LTTIGLDGSADVAVGLDEPASRTTLGLEESTAVAPGLDDSPTISKLGLEDSSIGRIGGVDGLSMFSRSGVVLLGSGAVKDVCDSICCNVDATSSKDGKAPISSE
jgi:hypothetical protein